MSRPRVEVVNSRLEIPGKNERGPEGPRIIPENIKERLASETLWRVLVYPLYGWCFDWVSFGFVRSYARQPGEFRFSKKTSLELQTSDVT